MIANDEAKLKKFSSIFEENSVKLARLLAVVFGAGVCWDNCGIGSTEIPICAMCGSPTC